jgi:hypothetical protein
VRGATGGAASSRSFDALASARQDKVNAILSEQGTPAMPFMVLRGASGTISGTWPAGVDNRRTGSIMSTSRSSGIRFEAASAFQNLEGRSM